MSEKVRKMFSSIADRYDLLNTILSFGIHHLWRKTTVKLSKAKRGDSVLDCAAGTGDLSFEFEKTVGKEAKVIATDFCEDMLKVGIQKKRERNSNIDFEIADAMNLRFEDNSFDISSIAFGIRNVDSTKKCLEEMARVVKSGGRVCVLEFGQPRGIFASIYNFYSKHIMPRIGRLFTTSDFAYEYLPETAAKYPCREEFIKIMDSTGSFKEASYKELSFGIAFIYIGVVK